jgi:hypothetical protein
MTGAARAAVRGFLVFVALAAIALAIGLVEYAASGGAYRLWTWIKVGFLYLVSFCGVGIRGQSALPPGVTPAPTTVDFRLPMMLGTALAVWLLFRTGRLVVKIAGGGRRDAVGVTAAAALGFAVPTFLVALPATLRFPEIGTLAPVWWQAAAFPLLLGIGAAGAGALWARRERRATRPDAVRAVMAGAWTMFVSALGLAFVGFLVLAALKPGQTGDYARYLRDRGRFGAVLGVHHVLFLPTQSVWILAPAMGGSTAVGLSAIGRSEEPPARLTLSGIDEGAWGRLLDPNGANAGRSRVALGGGFYLFLLVPAAATVLGGRRAAVGFAEPGFRTVVGAAAGVGFMALIAAATLFAVLSGPFPQPGMGILLFVTIRAAMPSTALLALAWGVGGGVLGALTAGFGPQAPVPD